MPKRRKAGKKAASTSRRACSQCKARKTRYRVGVRVKPQTPMIKIVTRHTWRDEARVADDVPGNLMIYPYANRTRLS
jgi:hypothetical protein